MERITWTRESCGTGKTCPRVGRVHTMGMVAAQGKKISPELAAQLGLTDIPDDEYVVLLPESLLPEV